MIVHSSALVAILRNEPDADRYAGALARSEHPLMSAANWLEAALLNSGDSNAYALAAEARSTLLYKGNDFVHTDLTAAG